MATKAQLTEAAEVVIAAYFLPAVIALGRNHPNGIAISIVNLFLGWTLIGWVVAMAWSVSAERLTKGTPRDG